MSVFSSKICLGQTSMFIFETAIIRCVRDCVLAGRPGTQVPTQSRDTFSSLCDRLTHLVFGGSDLVQSSVAAGPSSEGLLKVHVALLP